MRSAGEGCARWRLKKRPRLARASNVGGVYNATNTCLHAASRAGSHFCVVPWLFVRRRAGHTHGHVPNGHLVARVQPRHRLAVIVYAVVDDALSPDFPLGVELDVFISREEAERFIEEVRGDDPEVAAKLRIEERELDAGGLN